MKYLALDQAMKISGWSIFENDKLLEHGVFKIDPKLSIEARLFKFYDNITELKYTYDFDYMFFEDIQAQQNQKTYQVLSMVKAMVLFWCYCSEINYTCLAPSNWRAELDYKFGRQRAEQKKAAINFVQEKYGIEVSSDEADSICIGTAGYQIWKKQKSAF